MIKAYARTDKGKVREMNQDYFYISNSLDEIQLYILADGMGGYNGGEIASSLAVQTAKNYIENNFKDIEKDKDSIIQLVGSSMEYANMVVYEKAKGNPNLQGMGTTLEICLIYNNKAYIGHVGDSRIYRIRNSSMKRLTTDHSYVEQLIKEGKITKEEAPSHPKKNMLIKALGGNSLVEPDVFARAFLPGDIILICSDGLTNMLIEQEIQDIIVNDPICPEKNLIKMANEAGGLDNITVIIIKH